MKPLLVLILFLSLTPWVAYGEKYDVILRDGTIYDGSGAAPQIGSLGIRGDRIVRIGDLNGDTADLELDVTGLAVAPGFINMLSWGIDSLIEDGRSMSDIRQGVTLEVFGEGISWGPWNDRIKQWAKNSQGEIQYDIEWTTLAEFLDHLTKERRVSTNVASFVGGDHVADP